MDSETEMFLRDIVLNPQGELGYDFPRLDEDRPYSYLYTYKYGQAKLVFLSEVYGERVIQGILDQCPRLAGGGRGRGEAREDFKSLMAHVAGDTPALRITRPRIHVSPMRSGVSSGSDVNR